MRWLRRTWRGLDWSWLRNREMIPLALLAATLVVAPFGYGSVLPPGMLRVELLALLTLTATAVTMPLALPRRALLVLAALLGLILLGALQLTPLPAALLSTLSPTSAKVYADANSILQLHGAPTIAARISIAPGETISSILLTASYAAAFLSAAVLLNSGERRKFFGYFLLINALVQVAIGATAKEDTDRISGLFVNPNHFSAYLEIALAIGFGLLWIEIVTARKRGSRSRDHGERLEHKLLPIVRQIILWAAIGGGIALTRSRGGILAAGTTTLVLIFMASFKQYKRTRQRRAVAGVMAAILIGIVIIGLGTRDAPLRRFMMEDPRDLGSDTRVAIWTHSIEAWRLFPGFGSGLGAFREAFRRVQPRELNALVDYAHNDPLQLLVSGGAVGAGLGALAFLAALARMLRRWSRPVHREDAAMSLAVFGALLTIALHGLTDFNLSVPAIAVTLAVITGLGFAAADAKRSPEGKTPEEGM